MKYKPKSLKSAIILVVIVVAFILLLSYLGIRIHSPCFQRRLQSNKCSKIAPRINGKQGLFLFSGRNGKEVVSVCRE